MIHPLDVTCPICGARPGVRCTGTLRVDGTRRPLKVDEPAYIHATRWQAASWAGQRAVAAGR